MNKRNACFAGLAAAVTLLAGCAAPQYHNPGACEEEMRNRLAKTTLGELKVTHSATTYRGTRVVIEGQLEHGAASAVAASSAHAAVAASGAVPASSAAPVSAPQASAVTAPEAVAAVVPGMMAVPSAPAAVATGSAAQDTPTTPVAMLAAKLGIRKHPVTPAAAECIFNESGLTAFRWLAPAALAKTTPPPNAAD